MDADAAQRALVDRTQFNAIEAATGWKVDFLVRRDRPFSRAELARRIRVDLFGTAAWLASPEDTIIAKLEWATASGSDQQLRDVAGMLAVGWRVARPRACRALGRRPRAARGGSRAQELLSAD